MTNSILYVEDGPDDVFFMQRAFKKISPQVELQVITDGKEAVDFFESASAEAKSLALVLLDLNLPGQSGLQILSHIRKTSKYAKVPVILFTASSQQSDVDACYAEGCNAYVVKPNDPDSLKALISVINEFWLKANHYAKAGGGVAIVSADELKPDSRDRRLLAGILGFELLRPDFIFKGQSHLGAEDEGVGPEDGG